jgi:hypothetical protein
VLCSTLRCPRAAGRGAACNRAVRAIPRQVLIDFTSPVGCQQEVCSIAIKTLSFMSVSDNVKVILLYSVVVICIVICCIIIVIMIF